MLGSPCPFLTCDVLCELECSPVKAGCALAHWCSCIADRD